MLNLVYRYKKYFCEARKILKLSKIFFLIFEIPKLKACFEPSQNLNWISWVIEFYKMAPKCQMLSTNANHFLWENEAYSETLQKLFIHIGVTWKKKTWFVVCQRLKSNLLGGWTLVQDSQMQNLLNKCKAIFLGRRCKAWNFLITFFRYRRYL